MIVQTFKQGTHEIKIESVESIEDARANGFAEGVYSRYYLDGKIIDNYAAMIRFITEEAKKNNMKLIPNEKDLMKTRDEMLKNQNKMIVEQLEKLKKQYGERSVPASVLANIDDIIDKINPMGIRVTE